MKGILILAVLGRGKQKENTHIGHILSKNNIRLKSVFLTHLHFDHTAGIVELPKNIPYIAGKDEPYMNFTFLFYGDH